MRGCGFKCNFGHLDHCDSLSYKLSIKSIFNVMPCTIETDLWTRLK